MIPSIVKRKRTRYAQNVPYHNRLSLISSSRRQPLITLSPSFSALLSRTPALLALAACSVKLSGATAPAISLFSLTSGDGDAVGEWGAYLAEGLALGLLARHFEGITSALACMWVTDASIALY